MYILYIGGDKVEIKLQKWGNSLGIRIPSNILKSLSLKENDLLDIREEENRVVISKSIKSKISLKEKFKKYNGNNLAKEFSWDEPRGKELW